MRSHGNWDPSCVNLANVARPPMQACSVSASGGCVSSMAGATAATSSFTMQSPAHCGAVCGGSAVVLLCTNNAGRRQKLLRDAFNITRAHHILSLWISQKFDIHRILIMAAVENPHFQLGLDRDLRVLCRHFRQPHSKYCSVPTASNRR